MMPLGGAQPGEDGVFVPRGGWIEDMLQDFLCGVFFIFTVSFLLAGIALVCNFSPGVVSVLTELSVLLSTVGFLSLGVHILFLVFPEPPQVVRPLPIMMQVRWLMQT